MADRGCACQKVWKIRYIFIEKWCPTLYTVARSKAKIFGASQKFDLATLLGIALLTLLKSGNRGWGCLLITVSQVTSRFIKIKFKQFSAVIRPHSKFRVFSIISIIIFEIDIVARKQAQMVTICRFFKVWIALNPWFPPLPYRCSGVGTHRKMSMFLTMENIYASTTNPPDPRISILITTNKLSLRIWLQVTLCY